MRVNFSEQMTEDEIKLAILDAVLSDTLMRRKDITDYGGYACSHHGFTRATRHMSPMFRGRLGECLTSRDVLDVMEQELWVQEGSFRIADEHLARVMAACSSHWPLTGVHIDKDRVPVAVDKQGVCHVGIDSPLAEFMLEPKSGMPSELEPISGRAAWAIVGVVMILLVKWFVG